MNDVLERVILVDDEDKPLGDAPKLLVHERGELHRAFSVFIFDDNNRFLLQKRHPGKYHSGGLWTNACCGHPRPDEPTIDGATRRLHEEMGISCDLVSEGCLIYRADVGSGLTEHEFVHIYSGICQDVLDPDPTEVEEYAWRSLADIRREADEHPERFTAWFRIYLTRGILGVSPPA